MTINDRIKTLLIAAGEVIEDGRYLDGDFLSEHAVTSDECVQLYSLIGQVVKGFAHCDANTRDQIVLLGVTSEMDDGFRDRLNQVLQTKQMMQKPDRMKR